MINRIDKVFRALRKENKKAFIPYIMAGDPSLDKTRAAVLMIERCGADLIELGVPFTDPLADGPTIQRAAERALASGVTLRSVIGFVRELRKETKLPIVLMTYCNPVFVYGDEEFLKDAAGAGVDGVIIPDLPAEEAHGLVRLSKHHGIAVILLLAPTSTEERIRSVAKASSGYIYYVSMTGITGSRLTLDASLGDSVNRIRSITDKPIAVGFGISDPDEARTVAAVADGVIVGSAIVRRLNESPESVEEFVLRLRRAI